MKTLPEFCRKCGSGFPPREGEGTCKDWLRCFVSHIAPAVPDVKTVTELAMQCQPTIGDVIETQKRRVAKLEHDLAQCKEAFQACKEGKPLGPVIGAQTIINQEKELEREREYSKRAAIRNNELWARYHTMHEMLSRKNYRFRKELSRLRPVVEAAKVYCRYMGKEVAKTDTEQKLWEQLDEALRKADRGE